MAITDLNLSKKRVTLRVVGMLKETVVINDKAKLLLPLSG